MYHTTPHTEHPECGPPLFNLKVSKVTLKTINDQRPELYYAVLKCHIPNSCIQLPILISIDCIFSTSSLVVSQFYL